jgi:hypothetical protein
MRRKPHVRKSRRRLRILPQPDDSTCGPTCLHAIYRAYGDTIPLKRVVSEVGSLPTGGTLAVQLACHALRRGYGATLYTYNLVVFDPTWFRGGSAASLSERLRAQAEAKPNPKLRLATLSYLEYLKLGGEVLFEELNRRLIRNCLERQELLLTGLSATYLYECSRERGDTTLLYDDIVGEPMGHFVVIYDYDRSRRSVRVADPFADNPVFQRHDYTVGIDRLIGAVLLGVLTYDANLLVIHPRRP